MQEFFFTKVPHVYLLPCRRGKVTFTKEKTALHFEAKWRRAYLFVLASNLVTDSILFVYEIYADYTQSSAIEYRSQFEVPVIDVI